MEFNDSFGNKSNNSFGEEKKNNNISFEGNNNISFEENYINNNNNNNNISFEGNNNKDNNNNNNNNNNISFEENKNNNLSFDNMKIDENDNKEKEEEEEKKQNDIFNSVPMEIKNQESENILYYENMLITENIKHNLYIILNVIKKNIIYKKMKFFYELKYRADYKYFKLVQAEILFMSMQNKLKIFSYIEKLLKYKLLKENFIMLKKYSKLMKYKKEQDNVKEKEMNKKIKEVNEILKKNENNLKDISDTVNKLKNSEKSLNNELSELNKKYNKLNDKYNTLVQKSKTLKETIKKKENYSLTLDKTIDPKIVELQNIIKNKEIEKEKSMNYFEEFYQKMSDMLGMYESNYETFKSTINSSGTTNA